MSARRVFLLVALVLAACAHAAEISATLDTSDLRLRRGGPIPLEVRFQNPTPRLLEGRLEVTLLIGDRKAGVHRGAEIILQPGARTMPLLLPPPPDARPGDGIAAQLRWLGTDGTRDLGSQQIGIYGISGNEVVLGVVRTGRRLTELDHALDASLRVESLRPKLDAASWIAFTTHIAPIANAAMPAHPSGWYAYDAVFLDGAAFASANEKQLAALARWLGTGGSAGICTDARLDDRHIAFLDKLAAEARPAIHFHLDENGCATSDSNTVGTAPLLLRPGLGRAFVARDSRATEKDLDANTWHATVAWLWKFSDSEQSEVTRTGRWSKDFLRQNRGTRLPDDFGDDVLWSAAAGFNTLTPGAPRQMPLALVALVLGALLFTVGPADWFALGWLRRRRWTWAVFPVVCAAFTWWTVHLAGRYLGHEDRKGRVRILDLADDGRVLREMRYELLMPARDREWSFDLHDAVAASQSRDESPSFYSGGRLYRANSHYPLVRDAAALASNSDWPSPGHFTLHRALRQWTPAMVRITSFAEQSDSPKPDWEAALRHFKANRNAENWIAAAEDTKAFSFAIPNGDSFTEHSYRIPNGNLGDSKLGDSRFVHWLDNQDSESLGGLAVATSPMLCGSADLRLPKEQNPNRRTLLAWRRADGELLIYRRSFPAK